MRALVYTAPEQVVLEDCPRPHLAVGESEIAVDAAGICGSDISGFLGCSRSRIPPMVLGHELVGRTPDGRRVVANPLICCGRCVACLSGRQNLCSNWRLLGLGRTPGCFAQFVSVPGTQIYEIPDDLSDARALTAEPLANIVHLFRIAAPLPFFRLGIVGCGTMGSLALLMALRLGVREILVQDVNDARVEVARKMGVPTVQLDASAPFTAARLSVPTAMPNCLLSTRARSSCCTVAEVNFGLFPMVTEQSRLGLHLNALLNAADFQCRSSHTVGNHSEYTDRPAPN